MSDTAEVYLQTIRSCQKALKEIADRAGITPGEYVKKFENFIHPGLSAEEMKPFVDHLDALCEVDREFHELWQKKLRVSSTFWENAFASRGFGKLEEVRVYDDIMKRFARLFRGESNGANHKKPRKRNARKGDVQHNDRDKPSQEVAVSR